MKIHHFLTSLLLVASAQALAAINIGEPAVDFTLQDADGKTVTLADFEGKTVVLEWTNHQCPFVVKHYDSDNMQNLQKKYTAKDVVWLSIISSADGKQGSVTAEEAKTLTTDRSAAPTHVLFDRDGKIGKAYGAKTTPHMYVINTAGELVYKGAIDSISSSSKNDVSKAENYVDLALTEVLAGKPVSQSATRPYGCSVKY